MRIEIVPYRPQWQDEFEVVASGLRAAIGETALAIHHIGSTSIPGLPAKDIIDVQVTVAGLDSALRARLESAGYPIRDYEFDHAPPGLEVPQDQLRKIVAVEPPGERRANLHFRMPGRFNQTYALLFRDYLRAFPQAAAAYGRVKQAMAELAPDDIDAYYAVKDPAIDMLMVGARLWAEDTGWDLPRSDA